MPRKQTEFRKLHYELWSWVADNPDKDPYDWPKWIRWGGTYSSPHGSFACSEASKRTPYSDLKWQRCEQCPIRWGNLPKNLCSNHDSLLYQFHRTPTSDKKARSELARKIAELPWDQEEKPMTLEQEKLLAGMHLWRFDKNNKWLLKKGDERIWKASSWIRATKVNGQYSNQRRFKSLGDAVMDKNGERFIR